MRIPEAKIEEVRRASDIVDVISGYVRLKKRGKNFLGLCPFHTEKTPSFNVSPDRQIYHCFGCGVGGNVFTFVMEYEKVSFVEAVRTLAERAGIALPQDRGDEADQQPETETLYTICRAAARMFYDNMMNTVEGQLAREYFRHRGFSDETIRTFGLGYSLSGWENMLKLAEREKFPLDLLEKAGLIIKREDGSGYYDRFRGRAMFPIFSVTGRVVGFGARKLREDDPVQGKYINSPETPIYVKSRSLYGLHQAKNALREKEFALLVEGYADLISVYQAGIKNVVASSGTALTEEQINLISRYAKKIVLVYDADSAGSKAALRGMDLIMEQGLDVRIVQLPEGEDPDSFVKKYGGAAFEELVKGAVSFIDFKANMLRAEGKFDTPEGRAEAVRSLVESVAKVKDELKRSFYIKLLAERYGIYESTLYHELERLLGKERSRETMQRRREAQQERASTEPQTEQRPVERQTSIPATERDLLKLMLEHGDEMVRYVFSHLRLDHFSHPLILRALQKMLVVVEKGEPWEVNTLIDEAEDEEFRRFIADVTFSRYEISKGWKELDAVPEEPDPAELAERCMVTLKKQELERLLAENQRKMKEALARGEPARSFLEYHKTLLEEKKDLELYGLTGARTE